MDHAAARIYFVVVTKALADHRGVRNSASLPKLSVELILKWAEVHNARTGQWPKLAVLEEASAGLSNNADEPARAGDCTSDYCTRTRPILPEESRSRSSPLW